MQELQAEYKPTYGVLGSIKAIGKPRLSENSDLTVVPVDISTEGASPRKKVTYYFCFKPEWLVPGFNPNELAKNRRFVYSKNLANTSKNSFLQAISPDFNALADDVATEDYDDAEFQSTLAGHLEGEEVLFILEQERQKTDEINEETGKNVYARTDNYQIKDFVRIDPKGKAIKQMEDRATKAAAKADAASSDGKSIRPSFMVAWEEEDMARAA